MASRVGKIAKWTGISLGALIVLLVVGVFVLLSPPVLGPLVKKYAPKVIDAEVDFTRIEGFLLKDFPCITLKAENFSIIYPHDKYAQYYGDTALSVGDLGRGSEKDTFAFSRQIEVSLDLKALMHKDIIIPSAEGEGTRVFVHYFRDNSSNLDIFDGPPAPPSETEEEPQEPSEPTAEQEESKPWTFAIKHIHLRDHPFIVYADRALDDTCFLDFRAKEMLLDGHLAFEKWADIAVDFKADEFRYGMKVPGDTMSIVSDSFTLSHRDKGHDVRLVGGDFLYDSSTLGRAHFPLDMDNYLVMTDPPEGFPLDFQRLSGTAAGIDFDGRANFMFLDGKFDIDGAIALDRTPLTDLIAIAGDDYPALKDVESDGTLSLDVLAKGSYIYETGTLPDLSVNLRIPKSSLSYPGYVKKGNIQLAGNLVTDEKGNFNMALDTADLNIDGLHVKVGGHVYDLLGDDPRIRANGRFSTRVDSLLRFFPKEYGLSGYGSVWGNFAANTRMSQLDAIHYPDADINANVTMANLKLKDRVDSIDVFIPKGDFRLAVAGNKYDQSMKQGERVLALLGDIDSVWFNYADDIVVRGSSMKLAAQNGAKEKVGRFTPFMGFVMADRLIYSDSDSMRVRVRDTKNSFKMEPDPVFPMEPKFTVKSDNKGIMYSQSANRVALRNVSVLLGANKHDSAADTLRRRPPRTGNRQRPSWMTDEEFRKSDIDVSLDESTAAYIREWDASGQISIEKGIVATPFFPLRTRMGNLKANFDNDQIDIESLKVSSGNSDISASGTLKGLRRSLTSKGILRLDLALTSDKIDADELLAALNVGSSYTADSSIASAASNESLSDSEYQALVVTDTLDRADTSLDMIVIPANLWANVTVEGHEFIYKDLDVDWLSADIKMRQRTVQITNGIATSNMGDIYMEGFYSTHNRQDIRSGIDINMIDITAEDVIKLVPAIGEIEPMLLNFKGKLDCELAAVSDMDTTMSFKMPSLNGVMSITGKNLEINESEDFKEIAKTLFFRDKKKGQVKKMSVSGLVKDNSLQLYPFVLKIDRYTLALSGIQNFDESFKYHLSVLKSPLLVKFGVNFYGPDFDNWKFKLTKPKYRSTKVPVYTEEINTAIGELREAIHNVFETGDSHYDAARYLARLDNSDEEALSPEEIARLENMTAEENRNAEVLSNDAADESLGEEELIDLTGEDLDIATEKTKKECWLKRKIRECRERRALKKLLK